MQAQEYNLDNVRLKEVLLDEKFQHSEKMFSIADILIGLWLLNPKVDTFTGEPGSAYEFMGKIMPEWAWGLTFTIFGLTRFYAVIGHVKWLRTILSLWSAITLAYICYCLFLDGRQGLSIPLTLAGAIMNGILYVGRVKK